MKSIHKQWWNGKKIFLGAGAIVALIAGMACPLPSTYAAGKIAGENEDLWISLGLGVRTEFVAQQRGAPDGGSYSNQFGINNQRFYVNGQVHKYLLFEVNTECFNCQNSINGTGGNPNTFGGNTSIGLLDGVGKFQYNNYVNLWVGRLLVPGERGELNGPFYMAVFDGFKTPFNAQDFSGNFGKGGAGMFGRSDGVVYWGQVDPGYGHLQYSVGAFTGLQSGGAGSIAGCTTQACGPNQQSNLLYAGRLTFNFLNPEKNPGYYTSGTYYGKAGDILALAQGVNWQKNGAGSFLHSSDYTALITDLLFEKPLKGDMGVITANAEYKRYIADYSPLAFSDNSGNFGMFRGHSYTGYALYMFPQEVGIGRFQPYARYTWIQPEQSTNRRETEAGVNYVISGHNARVSAFWQYGDLQTKGLINWGPGVTGDKVNFFKLALQFQY
jgi:hypothetical protein